MELLGIRLTKRMDGGSVLRCVRADGSVTWQKQDRHAAFFALHDLTHFAVESTLGFRDGFFGLVAQGWDIDDTTGKGTRGRRSDDRRRIQSFCCEPVSFFARLLPQRSNRRGTPAR